MKHIHLPKLAEYEFINWDRGDKQVRRGEKFKTIEPLLVLFSDHEDQLPPDWV